MAGEDFLAKYGNYEGKPPLGLRPKKIVDHQRTNEILEAMTRYNNAGKSIPAEWIAELDWIRELDGLSE